MPKNEANDCAPRDPAFNGSKIEESFIIGFSNHPFVLTPHADGLRRRTCRVGGQLMRIKEATHTDIKLTV